MTPVAVLFGNPQKDALGPESMFIPPNTTQDAKEASL